MNRSDEILKAHRAKLAAATTFEEYKAAHIAYVDMLILRDEARRNYEAATEEYIGVITHSAMKWQMAESQPEQPAQE